MGLDALRKQDVKLVRIGNSRGVRIPQGMLHRYGFETADLLLEEREEGILIRRREDVLLSWEDTFQEMAGENEGWEDFEVTLLDGLTNDAPDSEEV